MALRVGDSFASYKDFETAFQTYKEQMCVEFTVVDSRNIKRINATTALPPLPLCLKFSRIRFCCIHNSKNKIKKDRLNQRTFALGCLAEVTVTACRKSEQLVIRKIIDKHNHPCNKASFDRYPAQRRLDRKEAEAVGTMLELGLSVRNISQKTSTRRFRLTMSLPCQHMPRSVKGVKGFTKEDDAECWHGRAVSETISADASVSDMSIAMHQRIPKTKCDKYKEAMAVFAPMADLMSVLEMQEFSAKLRLVTHLLNYWNKGIHPVLLSPDDPETDCDIPGNQAACSQIEIENRVRQCTAVFPVVEQSGTSDAASSSNEPEQAVPVAVETGVTAESGKISIVYTSEVKSGSIQKILLGKQISAAAPARGPSPLTLKKPKKEAIIKHRQRFLARPGDKSDKTKPAEAASGLMTLSEDSLWAIEQGHMLTDEHIHVASTLLKSRFPQCQGLADPVLGSKLMFGVAKGKFVQIIHDVTRKHWVTASNIRAEDVDVEVFDSLFTTLTMETNMQIATVLCSQKPDIRVRIVRNQIQQGSQDCGLFAIAVATSLLFGEKPEAIQYKQCEMRSHLVRCLRSGSMDPFPHTVKLTKRIRTKICVTSVYCSCRLPDNQEERMIQCSSCKEWYHQTCLHLTTKEMEAFGRSSEHFFCGVKCSKG